MDGRAATDRTRARAIERLKLTVALRWMFAALTPIAAPLFAQRGSTPVEPKLGRIVFEVSEVSRDTLAAPIFYIQYRTEHALSCLLPLTTRFTPGARTLLFDEWGIASEMVCPAAVGPASGGMMLPLAPGAQVLTIRHRGIDDRYEIDVTDERIRIRALAPPRVSLTTTSSLLRYPRYTFVVTCGTQPQPWVCDGVFRMVEAEAGIEATRMPGDGRNPYIASSAFSDGLYTRPRRSTARTGEARVYRYRSLADLNRLRTSMRLYREESTSGRNDISWSGRSWTGVTW